MFGARRASKMKEQRNRVLLFRPDFGQDGQ